MAQETMSSTQWRDYVYVTAYTIIPNYQFFIIYHYASMNKTIRFKKNKRVVDTSNKILIKSWYIFGESRPQVLDVVPTSCDRRICNTVRVAAVWTILNNIMTNGVEKVIDKGPFSGHISIVRNRSELRGDGPILPKNEGRSLPFWQKPYWKNCLKRTFSRKTLLEKAPKIGLNGLFERF
jgi:hypothetical protein